MPENVPKTENFSQAIKPVPVSQSYFVPKNRTLESLIQFAYDSHIPSSMKKHCIDLHETGQFSSFFLDYIAGKAELRPFYSHLPALESFPKAIENKSFSPETRKILCQSLQNQYEGIELFEEEKSSLSQLSDEKTFTVTTGHQLNLFTGPLYFIYKIVSTIRLAEQLNAAYPAYRFVPVYWMATEDHDFDEINYFKLDSKKYQWNSDQHGAVGDFVLDEGFREYLKTLGFIPEVFKSAYSSSKTLKEAVRKYVHDLFGKKGLLIVDGHDAALKTVFKHVVREDLFEHTPYKEATLKTESLESLGYGGQIFPREINLFYLEAGIRERIERQGDRFVVLNTELSFSQAEMEALIEQSPEKFSPNVVLRPLYQEMILPNLAYLGGPAEVVYWLQLKGVFDHFDQAFPILLPRNFALVLDKLTQQKMRQLGWEPAELFGDIEQWKKEHVAEHAQEDIELKAEKEQLAQLFDQRGESAAALEKSLQDSFASAKTRALKILDQMSDKLRKAEERRQHVDLARADAVKDWIAPGGSPQERVVNMMQFYLQDQSFVDQLYELFDPLDFRMMVLEP